MYRRVVPRLEFEFHRHHHGPTLSRSRDTKTPLSPVRGESSIRSKRNSQSGCPRIGGTASVELPNGQNPPTLATKVVNPSPLSETRVFVRSDARIRIMGVPPRMILIIPSERTVIHSITALLPSLFHGVCTDRHPTPSCHIFSPAPRGNTGETMLYRRAMPPMPL